MRSRRFHAVPEFGVNLRYGIVDQVDEQRGCVKVRLPDYGDLLTGWLEVLQRKTRRDRHVHLPDVGEDVRCLLDARGEDGCVLGAFYHEGNPPPVDGRDKEHVCFADGAIIEYDRQSGLLQVIGVRKITVQSQGPVEVDAEGAIHLKSGQALTLEAPTVTIKGNVNVEGDITASGNMLCAGANANHHTH